MNRTYVYGKPRRLANLAYAAGILSLVLAVGLSLTGGVTQAAGQATAPGLGEAGSYSVLAKAGVTNAGNSVLSGNVGADELASITGFPPGIALAVLGAPNVNQAQADAGTAYGALTAQAGGAIPAGPDLTGVTLVPGVYSVGEALLTGQITLDGPGAYVFLVASSLTSSGSISLINGARACDVFWQVTSSAAISGGSFVGTIIANTSITFGNGASLDGRALALTGNVTLINNSISGPSCAQAPAETETSTSTATITPGGPTLTPTSTPTITSSPEPSVTPGGPTLTPSATATPTNTPVASNTPGAAATATDSPPSYVDVEFDCAIEGQGQVRVGLSAGVIVYGLGADITSATDTGLNKIVRFLPVGHYEWHANPPAGHYMLTADRGVVDIVVCPGSSPVTTVTAVTSVPAATPVSVILPVTGLDSALATRQNVRFALGAAGLGLVLIGLALKRKQAA